SPAVRGAPQVLAIDRVGEAGANVVRRTQEISQIGPLNSVLIPEKVLIVLRQIASPDPLTSAGRRREDEVLSGSGDNRRDEATGQIGCGRVKWRGLERYERVWCDGVVVFVVVETGFERELRFDGPEPRTDDHSVYRLRLITSGRGS